MTHRLQTVIIFGHTDRSGAFPEEERTKCIRNVRMRLAEASMSNSGHTEFAGRQLGSGGFADVYLGEHLYLKTLAAIKVLRTSLSAQDQQQFLHEAQLKHMHIVLVLEFGIERATPFLVMDYAPKGTLRQAHPRGSALPLPLVVTYVKQIAAALQYAHDAKLIHRDVKPENILLGSYGEVLLSDFGIAVTAHHTSSLKTLDHAGTPPYMAPELIQGKPRPASDQYALGIVVYEWLCGERPFQGGQVLYQHIAVPPPPLHEKISTIPPAIEQVVLRALAKDPLQRFASIESFATALEQAAQQPYGGRTLCTYSGHNHRVCALAWSPDGAWIAWTDLARQIHLWEASTGRGLSTNLALHILDRHTETIAWSSDGRQLASGNDDQVVMVWDAFRLGAYSHEYTMRKHSQGRVNALAWSPDGRCLASVSFREYCEDSQVFVVHVWNVQTGDELFTENLHVPFPPGELATNGVVSMRWWSDSRRVALVRRDRRMEVWDTLTGQQLSAQHYPGGASRVYTVAWSPDGNAIAAITLDQTIEVWHATTASVLCAYRGHAEQVKRLAWSPDSKRIASLSSDGAIQVWDAATGRHHFTYCDPSQSFSALSWSPDGKCVASANRDWSIRVWQAAWGHE
jgi:eukaryotic-like serine/threonine-protein kinase